MHERRDLELDVVGSRDLDEIGALETVVEDRQATFVVGIARGVERTEQFVHAGESLRHLRHPSGRVAVRNALTGGIPPAGHSRRPGSMERLRRRTTGRGDSWWP